MRGFPAPSSFYRLPNVALLVCSLLFSNCSCAENCRARWQVPSAWLICALVTLRYPVSIPNWVHIRRQRLWHRNSEGINFGCCLWCLRNACECKYICEQHRAEIFTALFGHNLSVINFHYGRSIAQEIGCDNPILQGRCTVRESDIQLHWPFRERQVPCLPCVLRDWRFCFTPQKWKLGINICTVWQGNWAEVCIKYAEYLPRHLGTDRFMTQLAGLLTSARGVWAHTYRSRSHYGSGSCHSPNS